MRERKLFCVALLLNWENFREGFCQAYWILTGTNHILKGHVINGLFWSLLLGLSAWTFFESLLEKVMAGADEGEKEEE